MKFFVCIYVSFWGIFIVLVNSNKDTPKTNIIMNGETLEQVDNFKYLGALITEDGKSTIEIRASLAIALSTMSRLPTMWNRRVKEFQLQQR